MTPETKPTKIYLACPYSAPEFSLRELRARIASRVAAFFMSRGHVVFSPITHGHYVADHLPDECRLDHEFWMKQCLPFLDRSHGLVILPLPGWGQSRGLRVERRRAEDLNIPELFMPLSFPESFLSLLKETVS